MSAGSISSDCPMPYQPCSLPPRPCKPNSGYSCGRTSGSEVQMEWAVCRRCVVSEVPNSPDWITNAERPATRTSKTRGSELHCRRRPIIAIILQPECFSPVEFWQNYLLASLDASV